MKSIVDYISKSFLSLDLLTKEQNAIERLSGLILSTLAKNNQIFVQIPFENLIRKISYKI